MDDCAYCVHKDFITRKFLDHFKTAEKSNILPFDRWSMEVVETGNKIWIEFLSPKTGRLSENIAHLRIDSHFGRTNFCSLKKTIFVLLLFVEIFYLFYRFYLFRPSPLTPPPHTEMGNQ